MTTASSATATIRTPEPQSFEQQRRLNPRLWDTDWHVLRGMRAGIEAMAARICVPGRTVLDFGCGAKPYALLFTSRGCIYRGADLGGAAEINIAANGLLDAPDASADLGRRHQAVRRPVLP